MAYESQYWHRETGLVAVVVVRPKKSSAIRLRTG